MAPTAKSIFGNITKAYEKEGGIKASSLSPQTNFLPMKSTKAVNISTPIAQYQYTVTNTNSNIFMLRSAWLISAKLDPQFTVTPVFLVKTLSSLIEGSEKTSEADDKNLPPSHCNQPKFMPHIGDQTLCQENIPEEQYFEGIRFLHSPFQERNENTTKYKWTSGKEEWYERRYHGLFRNTFSSWSTVISGMPVHVRRGSVPLTSAAARGAHWPLHRSF